jgi:AcrR family transcriptional regulator
MDGSAGPRVRYREQLRAEVRARAWGQIGEAGASALSLKAIAKQMGMSAPALYRYFSSRDELLTELIVGAYRDLAETMEAEAAKEAQSPERRLRRLGLALRRWALADPHRYLLLYGTPVPGYAAPPEATMFAQRTLSPTIGAFMELDGGSASEALRRAVMSWTRLHGILSLELAGHFAGIDVDPELLYQGEVDAAAAFAPASGSRCANPAPPRG